MTVPSAADMLRALIAAGGTLPQTDFGNDWNDAGDFCFLHHLTDNDPETISITDKGRKAMADGAPVA